jgi:hypothetical protein
LFLARCSVPGLGFCRRSLKTEQLSPVAIRAVLSTPNDAVAPLAERIAAMLAPDSTVRATVILERLRSA